MARSRRCCWIAVGAAAVAAAAALALALGLMRTNSAPDPARTANTPAISAPGSVASSGAAPAPVATAGPSGRVPEPASVPAGVAEFELRESEFPGDWEDLDRKRGMRAFDAAGYAFDVSENMALCERREVRVGDAESGRDYRGLIQEALWELAAGGGGSVVLGVGVFVVGGQFSMPSRTCLRGQGTRSVVKIQSGVGGFDRAGLVRCIHSVRISVLDVVIDGNEGGMRAGAEEPYGRFGFFSELCNYVWIKGVTARNWHEYGFDPHGSNSHWSYYLVIESSTATANGLDGFTLDQHYYTSLLTSRATSNARHGVNVISGSTHTQVRNNTVTRNGGGSGVGCGISVQDNEAFGTRSALIAGNAVGASRKAGLCLRDVGELRVAANRVRGAAVCYSVRDVWDTLLERNACSSASGRVFKREGAPVFREVGNVVL